MNFNKVNIERLERSYDFLNEILKTNKNEISSFIIESKFPNTIKALLRLNEKIEAIKTSIDSLMKIDEIYPSFILLRSLIEHKIVAHYLWLEFEGNKNDNCAQEFYEDYLRSEEIKQEGYKLKVEGIKNDIKGNNNFENLQKRVEFLKDKEQKDLDKIHQLANQFSITRIANYLNNELDDNHPFAPYNKKVIIEDLLEYNILSSFVHAGPSSEKYIFEDYKKNEESNDENKLKYISLHIAIIIKKMLLTVVSREKEKYKKLISQIVKFNKENKKL